MTDLTKDELIQWFNDLAEQCKSLEGKTDSLSNAIRAYNAMQMQIILNEIRRRN